MDAERAPEACVVLSRRRSWSRGFVRVLRRGHLYAGLFLLPWVILFGITAFLFNHPSAFSDQPTATFGREGLQGTPFESPSTAAEIAQHVVTSLQQRAAPGVTYTLVEPERAVFTRDFVFAIVKTKGQDINILFDVRGHGGTVRARPSAAKPNVQSAPFALGTRTGNKRGEQVVESGRKQSLRTVSQDQNRFTHPLHEQALAAIPVVLERTGFPQGEATITSVPDVSFLMETEGQLWRTTYNAKTGVLDGNLVSEETQPEPLSTRRFLTRLHTAHGYPGERNAKWYWVLIADALALVMVFWGCSGILMWWQLKTTRGPGWVILLISTALATWLGIGMHELLSAAGR